MGRRVIGGGMPAMVARNNPRMEQQALDKLSDLRSRIKAARLEKLIARQMEEEVQLAPNQSGNQPAKPADTNAPTQQDAALEALADELANDTPSLQENSASFLAEPDPIEPQTILQDPLSQEPDPVDNSTTVAAAMERLVKRDELIKQLKTELEEKNQTIDELELKLAKSTTNVETSGDGKPALNLEELAQLQRAQAEKFEDMQQKNASLELKLAQHQNRLEIAAEEKQIAETRQDTLAVKAHELESELLKLRKMQLSIEEDQERKDRTIGALEAKVTELSAIKLALEKHIINLRHIKQTEADGDQSATG